MHAVGAHVTVDNPGGKNVWWTIRKCRKQPYIGYFIFHSNIHVKCWYPALDQSPAGLRVELKHHKYNDDILCAIRILLRSISAPDYGGILVCVVLFRKILFLMTAQSLGRKNATKIILRTV